MEVHMGTGKQGSHLELSKKQLTEQACRIVAHAGSPDLKSLMLMIMSARLLNTKPEFDKSFQIKYEEVRLYYATATLLHGVRT